MNREEKKNKGPFNPPGWCDVCGGHRIVRQAGVKICTCPKAESPKPNQIYMSPPNWHEQIHGLGHQYAESQSSNIRESQIKELGLKEVKQLFEDWRETKAHLVGFEAKPIPTISFAMYLLSSLPNKELSDNSIKERSENLAHDYYMTFTEEQRRNDDPTMSIQRMAALQRAFYWMLSLPSPSKTEGKKCDGNCGMNYCDDNGCNERKRYLVNFQGDLEESNVEISEEGWKECEPGTGSVKSYYKTDGDNTYFSFSPPLIHTVINNGEAEK